MGLEEQTGNETPIAYVSPTKVAEALLMSAGWARIGLTAPSAYLREEAAKELALSICEKLNPAGARDRDQHAFPL